MEVVTKWVGKRSETIDFQSLRENFWEDRPRSMRFSLFQLFQQEFQKDWTRDSIL